MNKNNREDGFTIVEILIGLGVATVFIFGIVVLVTTLNKINDRARDLALTNSLVENKIESLRSADFVALSDGTVDFTDELPASLDKPGTAEYTISSESPSLKKVDVIVTYDESETDRTLTYTTYIGELGVGQ